MCGFPEENVVLLKNRFLEPRPRPRRLWEPTWANLGAQEAPKDPQEAPKRSPPNFGGDLENPSAGALNRFTPRITLRALLPRRP